MIKIIPYGTLTTLSQFVFYSTTSSAEIDLLVTENSASPCLLLPAQPPGSGLADWQAPAGSGSLRWATLVFAKRVPALNFNQHQTERSNRLEADLAQCVQSACFVAWRLLSVLKFELSNHPRF